MACYVLEPYKPTSITRIIAWTNQIMNGIEQVSHANPWKGERIEHFCYDFRGDSIDRFAFGSLLKQLARQLGYARETRRHLSLPVELG